jgi:hypothetical protein
MSQETILGFCALGNILFFLALFFVAGTVRRMRAEINYLRDARTRDLEDGIAVWKRLKELTELQAQALELIQSRR